MFNEIKNVWLCNRKINTNDSKPFDFAQGPTIVSLIRQSLRLRSVTFTLPLFSELHPPSLPVPQSPRLLISITNLLFSITVEQKKLLHLAHNQLAMLDSFYPYQLIWQFCKCVGSAFYRNHFHGMVIFEEKALWGKDNFCKLCLQFERAVPNLFLAVGMNQHDGAGHQVVALPFPFDPVFFDQGTDCLRSVRELIFLHIAVERFEQLFFERHTESGDGHGNTNDWNRVQDSENLTIRQCANVLICWCANEFDSGVYCVAATCL